MIGFLCATPYHLIAATTIASGEFKDHESVLVLMDHAANVDEQFIEKIRSADIFSEVHLYKSNKKTEALKPLFFICIFCVCTSFWQSGNFDGYRPVFCGFEG